MNSALTELDEEDIPLSQFSDCTLTFTGADFKDLKEIKAPKTDSEIMDAFKYHTCQYLSKITEIEQFSVRFDEASVSAAAVKNGTWTDSLTDTELDSYGTFPNMLTTDDIMKVSSLSAAIDYAE